MIRRVNSNISNISSNSNRNNKKIPEEFIKEIRHSIMRSKQQNTKVEDLLRLPMQIFTCGICASNVQRKDMLLIDPKACDHQFCTECFTQFAIYKISVSEEVICPEDSCLNKMEEGSQVFKALPESIQDKWKQQELWRQTINNPNIKICPNEHCKEGVVDLVFDPPECRQCHRKYCSECMMQQHEGACDTNFQDHFREWKRCPQCKIFIQKDQGCNHMTCRCGYEFCFVCMAPWESSHYQCIEGLSDRIFFNEDREMDKIPAFFALIAMLFVFIFLLIGTVIAFVLIVALGIVVGALVAPCAAFKEMGPGCCICFLIVLPFVIAGGIIGAPIALIVGSRPTFIRIYRQYCNTVNFLCSQL